MLKNISNLGKTLNKAEQKETLGGRLPVGEENWPGTNGGCNPQAQCLNHWGRCTSRMSCNCVDASLNHACCEGH
ncbi:hypothetical protein [uncultured Dokdonia sp.]|uniref:hypothetical protein n=1 Tax=uncultured Dokdonia sp. TaxID=575653 RepID=UPI00261FCE88|nr:hypothetical protein [uncultured Dokdonia sp.]